MLQAIEYCRCGNELVYLTIILKQSDTISICERKPICPMCLVKIEIDLRNWGLTPTN